MTESPSADSGHYKSITDMNNTTQVTNNETEFESQWAHCSFISDTSTIYLIGGIGISLTSLIGIIGNILCAIVLSRPSMRTSTNIILFGLSVFDFMVVLVSLLARGIPWFIQYFSLKIFESFCLTAFRAIEITYFQLLLDIAQLGSTYFTLLVTVERFVVVYRPLMARPYCTNKNAIRASLVTAAFIILFTMPFWWEYEIESVYDENGSWAKYRVLRSLINNENYALYYGWVIVFVYRFIPVTLLTLLNISIYIKIQDGNKMRRSMSMTRVNSSDISVAKMLIWVVSIFLLCNSLNMYMYVRYLVGSENTPELIVTSAFLFNLNSAINFIIYASMGKKFRLVFLELFCIKKWRGRQSYNGSRNEGTDIGTRSGTTNMENSSSAPGYQTDGKKT